MPRCSQRERNLKPILVKQTITPATAVMPISRNDNSVNAIAFQHCSRPRMAARTRIVAESAALTARIERLQFERAHVTETRSLGTIEAELQRVQPSAASVWRATSGCRDVTLPESGHACAEVLALREALGKAQRRDVLDADLDRTEAQLARLPAVTAADPQSETATRLVNWATFGVINITANDVNLARVTSMILMPQTAGLVLLLAMTLWPSGGKNVAL